MLATQTTETGSDNKDGKQVGVLIFSLPFVEQLAGMFVCH